MCPRGRYGRDLNLKTPEECTICDAGYFCDQPGMKFADLDDSQKIGVGHFSTGGSKVKFPVETEVIGVINWNVDCEGRFTI
jgi:hypothetical protein